MIKNPVVLCILDGWGIAPPSLSNGIHIANTPTWDRLKGTYPCSQLEASELYVGLPRGQMGNSEVGHMTIGSGRTIMQDLPRIDEALASGTLNQNALFQDFIKKTLSKTGTCHLLGLLSPGGVHSHQEHLEKLAILLAKNGVRVWIHAFLDGRDTPPKSSKTYISNFQNAIKDYPLIQIATFGGRYFGMDRDNRWDRIEKAYKAIVEAAAPVSTDNLKTIDCFYAEGLGDEFIPVHVTQGYPGILDGDSLLMGNFRADRVRQILTTLLDSEFLKFKRQTPPHFSGTLGLTEYSAELSSFIPSLFSKQSIDWGLGEVVSVKGLKQLRAAETEKYAHVTFFFNGGRDLPFSGETRHLIPSPKVSTYDLKPEMSAFDLTEFLVSKINEKVYDLIVVNFANPDMVGHTGIQKAIIKAIETIDACLSELEKSCLQNRYSLVITADHGNVEQMIDAEKSQPHTAHTCNPVPFIVIAPKKAISHLHNGSLQDVAPTVLDLMGLDIPAEMTGKSLIA